MEKLVPIIIVVLILVFIVYWTQRDRQQPKLKQKAFKAPASKKSFNKELTLNNLKLESEKAFPRLKIKERNNQILICEIDHRGEFNELVFIKLNPNLPKSIDDKGRFIVASFPYLPTSTELKKSFGYKLNKY